jgi:phage N-6-adenine-methyltransferase
MARTKQTAAAATPAAPAAGEARAPVPVATRPGRRRCPRCRARVAPDPATGRRRRYCSDACRQAAYRKRRWPHPLGVHASSKSCEWSTPPALFDRLSREYGPFDLDACATAENAKCPRFYTRADDGLARPWARRVWLNPPYGRGIGAWVCKAWEAVQSGEAEVVVCLVPARVDTAWWHDYAVRGEVEFLPGRLKFGGAKNGAPFPSAVVVFRRAEGGQDARAC